MLEERARGVSAVPARVEQGGKRRHAAWLAESVQHAWALLVTEVGTSGRISVINGRFGTLKELGLEEGQGFFERIRLWSGKRTTNGGGIQTVHN